MKNITLKKPRDDLSLDYFTCQCGNVLIFNMSIKCLRCGKVYDFFSNPLKFGTAKGSRTPVTRMRTWRPNH